MPGDRSKVFNTFKYKFFVDGKSEPIVHEVVVFEDGHSKVDDRDGLKEFHQFTDLDNNKCEHCPLSKENSPDCPAAMNLASVINTFKEIKTSSEVRIEVESNQRTYSFEGVLTRGLHSLVGLAMASSDCPHLNFLRPMAMFHLPFADSNETIVRSMSFWLLKNYLKDPDMAVDFDPLFKKYGSVEKINAAMMERIRTFEKDDTGMHAIVILDSFISIFGLKFEGNMDELRKILEE